MLHCGRVYLPAIYMHCTRSMNNTEMVYRYPRPVCSIDLSPFYLYKYIYIYIYIYILKQCSGIQGLYDQLTGDDLSLFYIYIDAV